MKGGIYTDQKCAVCDAMLKDDGRKKFGCSDHSGRISITLHVHCGKVKKRFKSYPEAQRLFSGLRSGTDKHSFDERDPSGEKPLGYKNSAGKWLKVDKETVKSSSCRNPHSSIMKARKVGTMQKRKIVLPPFCYIMSIIYRSWNYDHRS
jgi:hypothetical protein